LFNELRDLNEPLDKDEFVDAGIRLYDVSFYPFFNQIFKDFEFEREKSNFKVRSKKERR
jgi:hypothetical protein